MKSIPSYAVGKTMYGDIVVSVGDHEGRSTNLNLPVRAAVALAQLILFTADAPTSTTATPPAPPAPDSTLGAPIV